MSVKMSEYTKLDNVLKKQISVYYHVKYMDEVVFHSNPNNVAIGCFQEYFTQCGQQVF